MVWVELCRGKEVRPFLCFAFIVCHKIRSQKNVGGDGIGAAENGALGSSRSSVASGGKFPKPKSDGRMFSVASRWLLSDA